MKKEKGYEIYSDDEVTRELLDTIKVGDLIKVNDWKKPYRVKAMSENYFVMTQNMFGNTYYSVCEKKRWEGTKYNSMRGGKFHVGTDHWVFQAPIDIEYDFSDLNFLEAYIETFESEDKMRKSELSGRTSIPINEIYIKRGE